MCRKEWGVGGGETTTAHIPLTSKSTGQLEIPSPLGNEVRGEARGDHLRAAGLSERHHVRARSRLDADL